VIHLIDLDFCFSNHGFTSAEETLAWFKDPELRDFRTFSLEFSPIDYLLTQGDVREAGANPIQHYLEHGFKENRKTKPAPRARLFAGQDDATREMPNEDVRVAIVLHIYYPEFIEYFLKRLARFDLTNWDVFVSAPTELVETHGQHLQDALGERLRDIRAVPNRGRNFAPLLIDFETQLAGYDAICHCHSKQSLYSGSAQRDWADYLIAGMIGAPDVVRRHVNLLAAGKCDLISPVPFEGIPAWASHSLSNDAAFRHLCDKLGLDNATGFMAYPVGGMFWMTGSFYRELARLNLSYDDFPPEPSQPDGEVHHALERLLGRRCDVARRNEAFFQARRTV
jgi:lipopolysaccharide biosynthesis protein